MSKRALVITDNAAIAAAVLDARDTAPSSIQIHVAHTPRAPDSVKVLVKNCIDVKKDPLKIAESYDAIISAHCKQLFPAELVDHSRCFNIHPGYNPETRGWFPQVWGIVRGLKVGMTVHVMDRELDHGPIIERVEVPATIWDTSESLYARILEVETRWLRENLASLIESEVSTFPMEGDGMLFSKADFHQLCRLDLDEVGTFKNFYDRLRALSFSGHRNAYFIDPATKKKVYLELRIETDHEAAQSD